MSERIHSDWLKAFMDYASYGEAPLKMLFWTGVSTIAGALRRRVWIDMGIFQWVPNFYVILVAPPGIVSKSTTAGIGMNLLRKIPDVKFGPDVVTWQSFVQALAGATTMDLEPTTGEYHPMSCITIASSEFGNFLNPSDREMVDVLVSLWDGQKGVFSKMTKTSGNDTIENPWVNIIACTTPAWISGNFPEYMIGGGFTSRCVFVYADKKRQLKAYPGLDANGDPVTDEFKAKEADLLHDLELISMMIGEYKLDKPAIAWGTEWYQRHYETKPAHLDNDQFSGYLARKQTHIHKLAMVIAASRSDRLVVTVDDLTFAEQMISALESDMPKVFNRIGQTEITKGAGDIVGIVHAAGRIEQTDLYRRLFRTMSYKDFSDALNSAIGAGHIKLMQEGAKVFVIANGGGI